LDVLCQDYIRTARAKGLPASALVYRHVLRNVLIPVITTVGLQFGALLGGAVLTESVFGWPGMGLLLVHDEATDKIDGLSGDVLGFIRRKECSKVGHVLRGREAAERGGC